MIQKICQRIAIVLKKILIFAAQNNFMLKHILVFSFIILLSACKQSKDKSSQWFSDEPEEVYEPLTLQDTAVATLQKVTIKDDYYKAAIEKEVAHFYKNNHYQARWLYQNKPSPLFTSYLNALTELSDYGLFPQNYRQHELDSLVRNLYQHKDSLSLKQLETTDREITASFLLLNCHLTQGRIPKVGDDVRVWKRMTL